MKLKYIILIIYLTVINLNGQNTKELTNFAKEFLPIWNSQEYMTIEVAMVMPDSLYSYKPTPEMRTFAQQMGHIAHTIDWMYEHVVLQMQEDKTKPLDVTTMSKSEVIEYLKNAFERGRNNINSLSEEDLKQMVAFFNSGNLSKRLGVLSVYNHITNHRAKANLYIRLCGITPPRSTYLVDLQKL